MLRIVAVLNGSRRAVVEFEKTSWIFLSPCIAGRSCGRGVRIRFEARAWQEISYLLVRARAPVDFFGQ